MRPNLAAASWRWCRLSKFVPFLDSNCEALKISQNSGLGQLHKKSEASKRMVSISIKRTDSTKTSRNPNDESVMKAQNKLDASSLLYASCWHHAGPVGDRQPQTLGLLRCRLRIGIASDLAPQLI